MKENEKNRRPDRRNSRQNGGQNGGRRRFTNQPKKAEKVPEVPEIPKVNPARYAAFRSLGKMKYGKYTNIEINTTLTRIPMNDNDKRLYTALVYGVTERLITLDTIISAHSSRPVAQIDPAALCALRLGIYQLAFMDKIPDHAAVSESVELAGGAGGFVNAVLRAFIRADKKIEPPKNAGEIRSMSARYSVPEDLCRSFCEWYGKEKTENIFSSFFERSRIALRVNTLKIPADEAAQRLSCEKSELCPDIIIIDSLTAEAREGIESGLWFVQDEASLIAVRALGAKGGETLVDCCAAPGGKSFSAAIDMNNTGSVYSFDLHWNKLSLIESGAKKLGIGIIKTEVRDAREPDGALVGKAERVLCDAPCSGLGVIGKKPDIKYKGAESTARLPEVQYAVLCGAARYVKDGGVLVYSTCTLNPAENGGVTKRFLLEHAEFELSDTEILPGKTTAEITLLPYEYNTDGFYICRMKKRATSDE